MLSTKEPPEAIKVLFSGDKFQEHSTLPLTVTIVSVTSQPAAIRAASFGEGSHALDMKFSIVPFAARMQLSLIGSCMYSS